MTSLETGGCPGMGWLASLLVEWEEVETEEEAEEEEEEVMLILLRVGYFLYWLNDSVH